MAKPKSLWQRFKDYVVRPVMYMGAGLTSGYYGYFLAAIVIAPFIPGINVLYLGLLGCLVGFAIGFLGAYLADKFAGKMAEKAGEIKRKMFNEPEPVEAPEDDEFKIEVSKQLKILDEKSDQQIQQITSLEQKVEGVQKLLEKAEKENAELKVQVKSLQDEVKEVRKENAQIKSSLEELGATIKSLPTTIQEWFEIVLKKLNLRSAKDNSNVNPEKDPVADPSYTHPVFNKNPAPLPGVLPIPPTSTPTTPVSGFKK